MNGYDLWWKRITSSVTFAVGTATFLYEVVVGHDLSLAALGVGVMGVPFGKAVEEVLLWVASLRPTKRD